VKEVDGVIGKHANKRHEVVKRHTSINFVILLYSVANKSLKFPTVEVLSDVVVEEKSDSVGRMLTLQNETTTIVCSEVRNLTPLRVVTFNYKVQTIQ